MRIIPVIDVMDGLVVRGVGGRREEYRPLVSRIVDSPQPVDVADALRDTFNVRELYVADLDAITRDAPQRNVLNALAAAGPLLLVDAGLRDVERAARLLEAGAHRVVAALETSPDPAHVETLVRNCGAERIVFSLDLRAGRPLGDRTAWSDDPLRIAGTVIDRGVRSMIVLDLAGVGCGRGVPTLRLCERIRARFPDIEILTGGGVRTAADLDALRRTGIDAALVASALHDGKISPHDVAVAGSISGG